MCTFNDFLTGNIFSQYTQENTSGCECVNKEIMGGALGLIVLADLVKESSTVISLDKVSCIL